MSTLRNRSVTKGIGIPEQPKPKPKQPAIGIPGPKIPKMPKWLSSIATQPDETGNFQLKQPVSVGNVSLKPGKYNVNQLYNQYKAPVRTQKSAASSMTKGLQTPKKGKTHG